MIGRRAFLSLAALAACSRRESESAKPALSPPPAEPPAPTTTHFGGAPRGKTELVRWSLDAFSTEVAIVVPSWDNPSGRFPLLVALHGRGEAVKPPKAGCLGWPNDYGMIRAFERLAAPPLTDTDYQGFSDPTRLATTNRELVARPFRGLVVVCPHVPDVDLHSDTDARRVGDFLVQTLLPRVRRELPVLDTPEATGIDGVSLGGALALRVGLVHPETFGAVGALQAAIGDERMDELTDLALAARKKRPKLALRLTTSHDDYYKPWVSKLDGRWRSAGIEHDYADVPGPHDYSFNRGPGVYEMLLWHDRVLG